jgi:hypothetical protein
MKRLRELEPKSPLEQRAQSLLDAVEPLAESRERLLRVRRALDRPRSGGLRRVPALGLGLLVVLFGASAFAAVRVYEVIERSFVSLGASAPRAGSTGQTPPHEPARVPSRSPLPSEAPAASAAKAARSDPESAPEAVANAEPARSVRSVAADARSAAARARDAASQPRPARSVRGAPARPEREPASPEAALAPELAAASDSELVHRAVKALRRDDDPASAARLLEQHRARSPTGPLAEEVLSLQIEAAIALRSARAQALAREYLARYPRGRYVAVAQRALTETAP